MGIDNSPAPCNFNQRLRSKRHDKQHFSNSPAHSPLAIINKKLTKTSFYEYDADQVYELLLLHGVSYEIASQLLGSII